MPLTAFPRLGRRLLSRGARRSSAACNVDREPVAAAARWPRRHVAGRDLPPCSRTCGNAAPAQGGNLSGGEQQMLAIGAHPAHRRQLLLLDEPTEGLAPVIVAADRRRPSALLKSRASPSCWSSRTSASPPGWPTATTSMEHGRVVDMLSADEASPQSIARSCAAYLGSPEWKAAMFELFGVPSTALFGQLLLGLINGSFYAMLEPGAGGHLRPAERHQLRARRAVHDGRLRRLDAAEASRRAVTGRRWCWRRSSSALFGIVLERLLICGASTISTISTACC